MRIRKDIDLAVRGKDVLLIEDIVDTGHTLSTILGLLRFRGARSVKLCALLDKAAAREVEVPIDYRGFEIEPLFVVGYGLDFDERYRNLPYIAVLDSADRPPTAPPRRKKGPGTMRFHHTDNAPKAIGPYSPGGRGRRLALPLRPGRRSTRRPASWSPAASRPQTRQVLRNLQRGARRRRLHLPGRGARPPST